MSAATETRSALDAVHRRPAGETRPARVVRAAGGLSTVAVAIIVTLALGGLSVLYLVQTSQVVQLGYALTRLQSEHDVLVLENSRLRYEIARYQSLDTVEQIARDELGMVPVKRVLFLEVDPPSSPAEPPREVAHRPVPWWQRAWDVLWGIGRASDRPDAGEAGNQ